jgi:hypothetical protein
MEVTLNASEFVTPQPTLENETSSMRTEGYQFAFVVALKSLWQMLPIQRMPEELLGYVITELRNIGVL